jgi:hypothetical protein
VFDTQYPFLFISGATNIKQELTMSSHDTHLRLLIRCLVLLGLLLIIQNDVWAQGRGKVTGRIIDAETSQQLPGANVMIDTVWVGGNAVAYDGMLGAATDINGEYVILNVPPGTYNLRASMIGYSTVVQSRVVVEANRTITVDFNMPATVIELGIVEVVWERPVIRADVAGTQEIIDVQRIEEVPLVRVSEFLDRMKGIELVATNEGMGLSVRGGSFRETDIRIDGISLRDPRSENSYLSLNSTTIEQVQVMTGGFEAKYGGIQSGLVNIITREGTRERYTLSMKVDMTPGSQNRFFGDNPWASNSPIYEVFTGKYAMDGIRTAADSSAVPSEFWEFRGWNDPATGVYPELPAGVTLTPEQKLELWKLRHPQYKVGGKPDVFVEGSLSGPLPGANVPLIGAYARRTTFLLGFKYEDSPFAFPLGPRDSYVDWNSQIKLTTRITPAVKLSLDGMYAKVSSLNEGRASNYGGLLDISASFNHMNNTSVGVRRQAQLLGGDNLFQMYNKSRLQFFDKRYILGGLQLNHTLSPRAYYVVSAQFSYTDNSMFPFELDTTRADAWVTVGGYRFLNVPTGGSPNASTNFGTDELGKFRLYGGTQRDDASYSWVAELKTDLITQLGRHNQLESGFSIRYNTLHVESGTWLQSERMWTPDTWQYYDAHPVEAGAYVQNKLEFEGMIATLGIRLDYFNANGTGFDIAHPLDPAFADLYNHIYMNLPGEWGSYERWVAYRELLGNPPGWEGEDSETQIKLSPRMGVSFPVTTASKIYFNYGHFYQRPSISFLYNTAIGSSWSSVPTPNLPLGRTVSYEFGYEQSFLESFLFNVTFYYKDVRNLPLSRVYINWYRDNNVTTFVADRYMDTRGIEFRLERRFGKFITFWANYDYMLQSSGQTGLQRIYENRLEASDEERSPNITSNIPLPRANINLNLRTPSGWGPSIGTFNPLADIYVNVLFEWRSGGRFLWNPQEPDVKRQQWVDIVNYSNVDLRASKNFRYPWGSFEVVMTVQNLLNQKRLEIGNMTRNQLDQYRNALKLPINEGERKGDDKWGEWDKEHLRDSFGWWTVPLFLNPQRIILGVRFNI